MDPRPSDAWARGPIIQPTEEGAAPKYEWDDTIHPWAFMPKRSNRNEGNEWKKFKMHSNFPPRKNKVTFSSILTHSLVNAYEINPQETMDFMLDNANIFMLGNLGYLIRPHSKNSTCATPVDKTVRE
ncbi:MAG: hypothetical protein AAF587_44800, partial [Bacteroidota bacterium]